MRISPAALASAAVRSLDVVLLLALAALTLRLWLRSNALASLPYASSVSGDGLLAGSGGIRDGRVAFASLCVGDATVPGTRVLFAALRAHNSRADFVALTHDLSAASVAALRRSGAIVVPVSPLEPHTFYMRAKKRPETEKRDAILWMKLRAWQLVQYEKVVMLDSDVLVLTNIDELFEMPEVSASAMIHPSEKISFYNLLRSSEYGMRPGNKIDRKSRDPDLLEGWSGLNSGVTVLKPSNLTFNRLLDELSIIPNRPCCPSQEFIYNFFDERKQYFRLPSVYNGRLIAAAGGGGADPEELEVVSGALKKHMKVYHFVGTKPWKKRDSSTMNKLWWKYFDGLDM
ncbi:hypothetical protein HDU84_006168 [Entophlyctis sp. JEL0112]|nr:hypothetical protein HDU84_006168 [Entophlyctis sp. JEL0112]